MDIVSIQPDAYINDLVYYDPGHMDKEILNTSCANSGCHNVIPVLKQQWDKFTEVYHQKYCRVVLSYCSKHCQEEHFNHISKSPWLVVTQHMPQNEDTMKVFVFSAAACRV
jgi:Mg2+/Co2+ transporter CorB